VNTTWQSSGDI